MRLRLASGEEGRSFFQEGVLHLELAYALPRLAKLAVLGLGVGPAGKLAPAVLHPLVHGLGIQAQFCAAFRYRPARRDDVVGGLAPELVGVLGGWVGMATVLSVVDECILKDWASSMRVRKDDTGHRSRETRGTSRE